MVFTLLFGLTKVNFDRSKMLTRYVIPLTLLLVLVGCTEEQFYEKEYLEGLGKAPDELVDVSEEGDVADDGTVADNDSNNGGGSDSNTDGDNGDTPDGGDTDGNSCNPSDQASITDNFNQNTAEEGKVDILWVVDNSGSMGDEQAALAFNFDVFINQFVDKDADFQMGITTTDTRPGFLGELSGRILTKADMDADAEGFKDEFKDYIKVGTNGSGQERGIRGSDAFMDLHGNSLLRDDAYLIIVYVSDEEDQSPETVQYYLDSIRSHKNNPGLLKAYSIVNLVDSGMQWESVGQRYIDFAAATGGNSSSIKEDFYDTLNAIGGAIVNLLSSFALSGIPQQATLNVSVDGVDQSNGWNYDEATRTLSFQDGFVPDAGSTIEVSYQVACQ